MEFAKEILEGLDYEINESSFTIRPLHTDEQKYTYKQSTQIEGPVSYTHLDVYKRQMCTLSHIPVMGTRITTPNGDTAALPL